MSISPRPCSIVRGFPLLLHVLWLCVPAAAWAQCQIGETTLLASRDNTLFEDGSGALSNGSGSYLFTGNTRSMGVRRALLHFDVAGAIPAGSTIDSASLHLNMSMTIAGSENVNLHPVLADWGEGASDASGMEGGGAPSATDDATWIHTFFNSAFWANSGGDFSPMASATTAVDGNGVYTWGSAAMMADVQSWLDDPMNNFGWILVGNESATTTAKRFDARENSTTPTPPTLCVALSAPAVSEIPTLGNLGVVALILMLTVLALRRLRTVGSEQ